jgi:hypothetical protein
VNALTYAQRKAPHTFKLCLLLLGSAFFFALFPQALLSAFALKPCESSYGLLLLGAVLHPFATPGLLYWLEVTVVIALSAVITERDLGPKGLIALWIGATIFSALTFTLLSSTCHPVVGPLGFAWSLAGTVPASVAYRWKEARFLEKAFAGFVVAVALSMTTVELPYAAISLTSLAFGALTFALIQSGKRRLARNATAA